MKKSAKSRTGWWIAGLLEKHFHPDHAPYWNNYRLIKADDWRSAFRKATEMGEHSAEVGIEAFGERQEFVGVSDLIPIYDEFEDGAEILWEELWPDANNPNDCPLGVFSEAELELEYEDKAQPTTQPDSK